MGKIEAADIEAHVDDVDVIVRACAAIAQAMFGEFWRQRRRPQRLDDVRQAMTMLPTSSIEPFRLYEEHIASAAARHADVERFVEQHGRELRDGFQFGARTFDSAMHAMLHVSRDVVRHHELEAFADAGEFVEHGLDRLRQQVRREAAKLTAESGNGKATSVDGYVLASTLVRPNVQGRHDTKAVRRFAEKHDVDTRREGQRRYIDGEAFDRAWRDRERAAWQRLDDIDTAKRDAARKRDAEARR